MNNKLREQFSELISARPVERYAMVQAIDRVFPVRSQSFKTVPLNKNFDQYGRVYHICQNCFIPPQDFISTRPIDFIGDRLENYLTSLTVIPTQIHDYQIKFLTPPSFSSMFDPADLRIAVVPLKCIADTKLKINISSGQLPTKQWLFQVNPSGIGLDLSGLRHTGNL